MNKLKNTLLEARMFATKIISSYTEVITYHDIKFANSYINNIELVGGHANFSEEEILLAKIGGWLIAASFQDYKVEFSKKNNPTTNLVNESIKTLNKFLEKHSLEKEEIKILKEAFKEMDMFYQPETKFGKVLSDSITVDIVMGNSKKNLKRMYEEMLLKDANITKKKWLDIAYELSKAYSFHIEYCKEQFLPMLQELQTNLLKEKKQIDKTADFALQRELEISDIELKELKKNLNESKGRDGRGIQTMFRTASKNHYTLNDMVDSKARIMITVNSIIISLIIGGLIDLNMENNLNQINWEFIPVLILILSSLASIIFAILAIRPEITHGTFTEEDIRNKNGNLLYFGNYHNMNYRDYEWGFLQMMNDQDFLYTNMIKDIYFLGLSLKKKFTHIRLSLTLFLFGFVLSVVSYIFIMIFTSNLV